MTRQEAYNIIDQLIGTVNVNREVGRKRDEAMDVLKDCIAKNCDKDDKDSKVN